MVKKGYEIDFALSFSGIYEIFSGSKKIYFGKQPEMIEGTNTVSVGNEKNK